MAIDIYSTRAQLAALELMPMPNTFLYDTFVADAGCVEDDEAIYDYAKGEEVMAPFVTPGTGGVLMGRTGYQTRQIGFATIAPERIITNPDLKGRAFGESILGAMTPEQREKKMLNRDLTEMRAAIQRRREWMAREVITTGKLPVLRYTNEGKDVETTLLADYQHTNKYTPVTRWGTVGAKIDHDMHEITDIITEGLGACEIIVMAPDVAEAMLSNSDYIKQHDIINAKAGEIAVKYRGQGVRFLGWNSDGVEMYSFSGKFTADDKTRKRFIPNGMLIAGSKGMIKCYHGPVTQVEDPGPNAKHKTYIKREVPLRYGSIDGNSIKNRLTSCPTMVPVNVDGWVIGQML